MKILIAGGTGFIGSAIVKKLQSDPEQRQNELYVLTRMSKPDSSTVKYITGDVTKPETLKNLENFDAVVMCVQFPNHPVENPKKGFTYEKVDAEGTENLCAKLKNTSVKKIVYLSGAGTHEGATPPWFKAKLRAEKAVKDACKVGSGKNYVILRPSWVYGPGDKSMSKFIVFSKLPVMPVIGAGTNRVSPLFIDDLAQMVVQSLTSEAISNITIEVGGPEVLSMNEIQSAVLHYKKKSAPLLHQPLWMAKLAGDFLNLVLKEPPLSRAAVDFIMMDNPTNSLEAEKVFGFKPRKLSLGLSAYK